MTRSFIFTGTIHLINISSYIRRGHHQHEKLNLLIILFLKEFEIVYIDSLKCFLLKVVSGVDLIILVETSSKVTKRELENIRKLIQSFATRRLEKKTVRLGVIAFSKDVRIERQLQILDDDDDAKNKNNGNSNLLKTLTRLPGEPRIAEALEQAAQHLMQSSQSSRRKVVISIVKTLDSSSEIVRARNIIFKMQQRFKNLQAMSILLSGAAAKDDHANLLKVVSPLVSVPKPTNVLIIPDAVTLSTSLPNELASRILKGSCFLCIYLKNNKMGDLCSPIPRVISGFLSVAL